MTKQLINNAELEIRPLADLGGANLSGIYLFIANLSGANLSSADLSGADLSGVDLSEANLSEANLSGADLPMRLKIDDLGGRILDEVGKGDNSLDMAVWHTCKTTHSRAGWAIVVAGEAGKALEDQYGTSAAAAIIYASSYPDLPVPDFFASDGEALEDIRYRASLATI